MRLRTISASFALLGMAITTASATEATPAGNPAAAAERVTQSATSAAAAMSERRVVRDSVTGKLRPPTADELSQERAARQAQGIAEPSGPGAPLAIRQHASGMRSAVLGADYLVTLKAQRKDGKLIVTHENPADQHPGASQTERPTE